MIFSYNEEQDVLSVFLKFNNWKVGNKENEKRFLEQVKLVVERIEGQHIFPKIITDNVDVYYAYSGDDFVKGKMTLRLKFKIEKV